MPALSKAPPTRREANASPGVGTSESSPLLLTEGGPEGAGCGGEPVRFFGLLGNLIHPTSVSPDGLPPCSSGMTATGSHVDFYSLRGAQPQGEGFGRCCIDSPYRPSSGPFGDTSPYTPGGKRIAGLAYEIRRIGACRRPCKAPTWIFRNKRPGGPEGPSGRSAYFSFCRRTSMTRAAWFRCRMAAYSARWASSGV